MNPQANKQLMQTIFARTATGDGALFVEHLADDVIMRVTGKYSWSQTFSGKTELLRRLYGYLRTVTQEPRKTIPLRFIADEDYVVVEARGEMKRTDGVPYENEYCLVFRLRDGRIVELREYQDSTLCEKILGPYPLQDASLRSSTPDDNASSGN